MPISRPQRGHGRHDAGFTMIELMVAVSLVAILAAMAGPSFSRQIEAGRQRSAVSALQQAMRLANAQAMATSRPVVLCASSDETSCGADWNDGWVLFVDRDRSNTRDAGEALLQSSNNGEVRLFKADEPLLTFRTNGVNDATSIRICSEHDSTLDLELQLSSFGLTEVVKGIIGGCS